MNDTIPATLEAAIKEIKRTDDTLVKWAKRPEDEACAHVHRVTGTHLRNRWGLWTNSVLAVHLEKRFGLTHADDMSGLIFRCLHRELNDRPWNTDEIVAKYKAFWAKHSNG